jgi:hypothetical protein
MNFKEFEHGLQVEIEISDHPSAISTERLGPNLYDLGGIKRAYSSSSKALSQKFSKNFLENGFQFI